MSDHPRIWLEPSPGADPDYGRQWCQHGVWEDGTEYVRADLACAAHEQLSRAFGEAEADKIIDDYRHSPNPKNTGKQTMPEGKSEIPVCHLVWLQARRAADDVEDYYEVARQGDKCVDGSDPFPVYMKPSLEGDWRDISTYSKEDRFTTTKHILCGHSEKKWIRMGRWYPEVGKWYYSGTNERSQWAQVEGDAPTHWMPLPSPPSSTEER